MKPEFNYSKNRERIEELTHIILALQDYIEKLKKLDLRMLEEDIENVGKSLSKFEDEQNACHKAEKEYFER